MSSPPNSSAIANSLIGVLLADSQLAALLPDGVYYDVVGKRDKPALRYVIVSLVDSIDLSTYEGRAIESGLYLVKAVARLDTGANVDAAAARIDQLLHDQFWPIAPDLVLMSCARVVPIRATERDQVDPDILWNHRGGRYHLDVAVVSPLGRTRGIEPHERAAS